MPGSRTSHRFAMISYCICPGAKVKRGQEKEPETKRCICMDVYIHVYIYIHTHTHACIYIYRHTHRYMHMFYSIYFFVHTRYNKERCSMCMSTCECIYLCRSHMKSMCVRIYVYTYIHIEKERVRERKRERERERKTKQHRGVENRETCGYWSFFVGLLPTTLLHVNGFNRECHCQLFLCLHSRSARVVWYCLLPPRPLLKAWLQRDLGSMYVPKYCMDHLGLPMAPWQVVAYMAGGFDLFLGKVVLTLGTGICSVFRTEVL